ncbi:MAG: mechanosensitive ion channel [Bacteroidia bacterium]|nr:mechanosensitive ion channel [Bacteroidia bacterium]
MDWDSTKKNISEIFNVVVFDIQGSRFTLLTILYIVIAIWLLLYLSKKFSLLLQNKVLIKRIREPGARYSIATILRYLIVLIGFIFIVQSAGFDMTSFGLMAGALGVGIGFGLQNLFSDFVSGVILLFDSSVKVGDVIDVDGLVCTVTKINLRTTQVLTRDDKYILLPNTLLTKNRIINWTHNIKNSRFDISVGVDYASNVELVMRLLRESAEEQEGVDKTPEPFVRFNEYADSALLFTVYFWSSNVFRVENTKSEIRRKIFHKFEENNIIIPFPQRTLHILRNNDDAFFPDNNKK